MSDYPRTLLEFQHIFPDEAACARHLEIMDGLSKELNSGFLTSGKKRWHQVAALQKVPGKDIPF